MVFILLSFTATLISSIAYGSQLPLDGFSSDPLFKLIRPDIFENTTTQILANVGDSVQFECYASGTPGANISIEWSRPKYISFFQQNEDNLTLPNGEMVYSGNILKFPSVQPEHAGSYDCNAYEEHTLPGSRSYLLSVKSKPTISNAVITKTFKEKNVIDTIRIHAENSAVPQGKITWYKDDKVLNNSDKYAISTTEEMGISILTISVKDNDDYHGTYKYFTENKLGQTEYSFVI